jgi:hypothetical protein
MNATEAMLVDKLKGHTYKMSPYQYAEVMSHIDPELTWIVNSKVSDFAKDKKTVPTKDLFYVVASSVADVMCERLHSRYPINSSRISKIMYNAYKSINQNPAPKVDDATDMYLIYAVYDAIIQIRYCEPSL